MCFACTSLNDLLNGKATIIQVQPSKDLRGTKLKHQRWYTSHVAHITHSGSTVPNTISLVYIPSCPPKRKSRRRLLDLLVCILRFLFSWLIFGPANINSVKAGKTQTQDYQYSARKNNYYNPNYKPRNTYVRPAASAAPPPLPSASPSQQMKEVVLNGVAFESSGRSLVRKDCKLYILISRDNSHIVPAVPKPVSSAKPPSSSASRPLPPQFSRKAGHMIPSHRVYKPTSSRGRRGGPVNRNMTLRNSRRPYQFVFLLCRQRTLNDRLQAQTAKAHQVFRQTMF